VLRIREITATLLHFGIPLHSTDLAESFDQDIALQAQLTKALVDLRRRLVGMAHVPNHVRQERARSTRFELAKEQLNVRIGDALRPHFLIVFEPLRVAPPR
jgi:hypothetical protein